MGTIARFFRSKFHEHVRTAGEIVLDYLYKNDVSQSKVARSMEPKETPQGLGRKLHAGDLNTSLLERISKACKHNFFLDLSHEYVKDMQGEVLSEILNEPEQKYGPENIEKMIERVIERKLNEKHKDIKKK